MSRQYFYKVDACLAKSAGDPDCICWHDEGTGPMAGSPYLQTCEWRGKPEVANPQPDTELPPCAGLADYLASHADDGCIDFSVRVLSATPDGSIRFYIRPTHISGETRDYVCSVGKDTVLSVEFCNRLLKAAGTTRKVEPK